MKLSFFLSKLLVIQNEFSIYNKKHIKNILTAGNLSWNIGILCALDYCHTTPQNFITQHNIQVITKNAPVLLDKLLFSSFNSISNQITLYTDAIDSYLTLHAPTGLDKTSFTNLLLSHEIFHFLQCNNFCVLFSMSCLNEIAAYAFAKKICITNPHLVHTNVYQFIQRM